MLRMFHILLFSSLFTGMVQAQGSGAEQVQAVVKGTITGHSARILTLHLAKRPGVLLCRIDPISHNVLLHLDQHARLTEHTLRSFFALHGLALGCFMRGPLTDAPFHPLDPRTCDEPIERK